MNQISENIPEKVKANAVSAYLLILISGLFLFNKTNKNIDHLFVKSHTKTAMLIHFGFLITYIIFISNSLFSSLSVMGFGVNHIITIVINTALLFLLVLGIYKAQNGLEFNISENISISKKKAILDIDGDGEVSEREKVTILLSFVPFIGFINFSKYRKNETIQNATRLNIIITLIISLLYIFSYGNLATLFSLAYTVLITFIGINLFTRNELVSIKLPKSFSPENTYILMISIITYLKNYFSNVELQSLKTIIEITNEKLVKLEITNEAELSKKKGFNLPKFLIYIPLINLVFLFYKNTRYSFHITNGLIITLLLGITGILAHFGYINPNLHLLALFPIFFGISYLNDRLAYRMPVIFDIYVLIRNTLSLFKFGTRKLKEKKAEENEVSLKVK